MGYSTLESHLSSYTVFLPTLGTLLWTPLSLLPQTYLFNDSTSQTQTQCLSGTWTCSVIILWMNELINGWICACREIRDPEQLFGLKPLLLMPPRLSPATSFYPPADSHAHSLGTCHFQSHRKDKTKQESMSKPQQVNQQNKEALH